MSFPVAPVVMPADLVGQSNGNLPAGLLTDVGPSGKLHHLAARAFRALVSAAWDQGLPLTYTYGGTYRPYVAQETLFRSRYVIGGTGGGCKSWDSDGNGSKESWCKKSSNLATAAVPGTSNHGWGLAVDTAFDTNPTDGVGPDDAAGITGHPQWPWLLANAERFGFSWELQSEPWHIRYVAGDAVPQAVLDFEAPTIPPPTQELPMKYYALPPTAEGNRAHIVVIDAACRYRTNGDTDPLPEIRLPEEQYVQLRKSAGLDAG